MQGLGDIMRQAQQMQAKMAKIQEELALKLVEGSSGGGMVKVVCTGKQEIRAITIDKTVVSPEDVDMLQDLVMAAVNDALRLSREMLEQEMKALTGGISIPGMF